MEVGWGHAAGVAVAVLSLGATPVLAQEANGVIEEVVVTGSRLTQPNMTGPTAVNVLDRQQLDLSGAVNVSELIRTLPATGVFHIKLGEFELHSCKLRHQYG